jgi:hypothetical protein
LDSIVQTYTINTFAGGGVNVQGTSANLPNPYRIAVDGAGNVFFTYGVAAVLRLDAITGVLTLVAGNGTGGTGIGPATGAVLNGPAGLAVDGGGNVYIADLGSNIIRRVANGLITIVAGSGSFQGGFGGDNGPATSASLNYPEDVAVDSAGNLYIADTSNNRIREVSNGVITTVAGSGAQGYGGDNGPAASLHFSHSTLLCGTGASACQPKRSSGAAYRSRLAGESACPTITRVRQSVGAKRRHEPGRGRQECPPRHRT